MKKAPSPEPSSGGSDALNRPTAERSSSMKWASSRQRRRWPCCECSRSVNSNEWEAANTISVDVRVLAATNRDLGAAVAEGTFRQDLFYRLNVFPIRMPALRERVDDIPILVEYLIDRYAERAGKSIRHINKSTLDLFQAYDWPGNMRELQNVIERAVILCDGETFGVDETWLTPVAPKRLRRVAPWSLTLSNMKEK